MYIRVICASCSCQLKTIESMGDFGVVSYLADADGNVNIGPGTPVPACHSTKPSTKSIPTTPTTVTPTQTPTPANPTPQNKTTTTPTPESQTPGTPTPSTPPTKIPENQSPGTPTPQNQTSDTPIPQHPANPTSSISNSSTPQPFTPTPGEKSANNLMDDKEITAMLEGETGCRNAQTYHIHSVKQYVWFYVLKCVGAAVIYSFCFIQKL